MTSTRKRKEPSSTSINLNGKSTTNNNYLKNYYYNPKNPGSFSGLSTLRRHIKKSHLKKLPLWIQSQETYTLHKPARKKFQRNKTIVYGIDDTWQADLIDMQNLSKYNDNYRYLISIIDVFSKYAWVIPLKNKTQESIIAAFKSVFKLRKPKRLHTDAGSEFIGQATQKYLKENEIKFYFLNSEMKAAIVERFNRTIKEKMWRYFTKSQNYTYINIINDLIYSYNHSYHRAIKMRPIDVKKQNENKVFINLYGNNEDFDDNNIKEHKIKFKIGDKVRISKSKYKFEKGYTPNWTREIFEINKIILRDFPVYKIIDYDQTPIEGVFYAWELQKVDKFDDNYLVEEILKTRFNKIKNKKEYFVKWVGYPESFNSWVIDLQDLE